MKDEQFVICIHQYVIKEMMHEYQTAKNLSLDQQQWPDLVSLIKTLNQEENKLLFNHIEQTIIDTISTLLGILDGSSYLKGFPEDFCLTYGENKEVLNGCLQDYFLSDIQEMRKNQNTESSE